MLGELKLTLESQGKVKGSQCEIVSVSHQCEIVSVSHGKLLHSCQSHCTCLSFARREFEGARWSSGVDAAIGARAAAVRVLPYTTSPCSDLGQVVNLSLSVA